MTADIPQIPADRSDSHALRSHLSSARSSILTRSALTYPQPALLNLESLLQKRHYIRAPEAVSLQVDTPAQLAALDFPPDAPTEALCPIQHLGHDITGAQTKEFPDHIEA